MIKAIAFDPGKTTGFAVGDCTSVGGDILDGHSLATMYVTTAQAQMTHADIMNWLGDQKPKYIICESFNFRNAARTGLELISREFIGVINLFCEMNPDTILTMQTPSQAIGGYWTDDKLKRLNLYRKPINKVSQIHANEACKHLLYWGKFGAGYQYCKGNFAHR